MMATRNKAGLHITGTGSREGYDDFINLNAKAGSPIGFLKGLDTIPAAGDGPEYAGTVVCVRRIVDDEDFPGNNWHWSSSADCLASATHWMSEIYRWLDSPIDYLNPTSKKVREFVHYTEFCNEPNMPLDKPGETEGATMVRWFEEWSRDCMESANAHGVKLAWGGFSAGCPPYEHMDMLLDLCDYSAAHGHILAMHDGGTTEDALLFKQAYPGSALRHRTWKAKADASGKRFPLVGLTEVYAYGKVNDEYWADWEWYLKELAKDDYVLGAAWFTLGDYEFSPGESVNVAGDKLRRFTELTTSIKWNELPPPPPEQPVQPLMLKVNYRNQNSIDADLSVNDCGPACEAMAANYVGGDMHTVNEWYLATGAGAGLITIDQMAAAASNMGYTLNVLRNQSLATLRAALDAGKPCILLVNPVGLQKRGTTAPHFVLAVGYSKVNLNTFYCHDPYFLSGGIGGPMIEQPTLDEAWRRAGEQGNQPYTMMTMDKGAEPEPAGSAWRGLQLRNGENRTADWQCVTDGRLDGVKFTTDTRLEDLNFACTLVQPDHILLRLFADLSNRIVSPVEFGSWFTQWLERFAQVGGRYVEVHNEPNLYCEGLGQAWHDGLSFGTWLVDVLAQLRRKQPGLLYGFPALSPGSSIQGTRMDEAAFYAGARFAAQQCDWIGVHCYWLTDLGMYSDADGAHYRVYKDEGKPLIVTEFSNPGPDSKDIKGRQYKAWYAKLPSYVLGGYAFISSADNPDFASEAWAGSSIPDIVGEVGA